MTLSLSEPKEYTTLFIVLIFHRESSRGAMSPEDTC
jgi:hypothetical protein